MRSIRDTDPGRNGSYGTTGRVVNYDFIKDVFGRHRWEHG
jgi:hypothetical protein